MSYFLEQDLNNQKIYISHLQKIQGKRYLIICEKMYEAQNLLKELKMGKIKGPHEDIFQYIECEPLGDNSEILVFKRKK